MEIKNIKDNFYKIIFFIILFESLFLLLSFVNINNFIYFSITIIILFLLINKIVIDYKQGNSILNIFFKKINLMKKFSSTQSLNTYDENELQNINNEINNNENLIVNNEINNNEINNNEINNNENLIVNNEEKID